MRLIPKMGAMLFGLGLTLGAQDRAAEEIDRLKKALTVQQSEIDELRTLLRAQQTLLDKMLVRNETAPPPASSPAQAIAGPILPDSAPVSRSLTIALGGLPNRSDRFLGVLAGVAHPRRL